MMKNCPFCDEEILDTAKKCKHCGEWFKEQKEYFLDSNLPQQELKVFNWGSFLLTWIWGIRNNSYKCLWSILPQVLQLLTGILCLNLSLSLSNTDLGILAGSNIQGELTDNGGLFFFIALINGVSYWVNFSISIWFGFKGNKWAWENKEWNSIEEFRTVQRKLTIIGIIIAICTSLLVMLMASVWWFIPFFEHLASINM